MPPADRPPDDVADAASRPRLALPAGLLEVAVAAAFTLVAAGLWFGSYEFAEGGRGLAGPAAFPRGIAVLLAASSALMAARGAFQLTRGRGQVAAEPVTFRRPAAVAMAAALIVLYPILLSYLGFYPATALWLPALLWAVGQRNLVWGAVTTLGFLLTVRVAFQTLMGVPLP